MPAILARRTARARAAAMPPSSAVAIGGERQAFLDRLLSAVYDGPLETPPLQTAMEMLREQLGALHVTLIMRPPSPVHAGVMVHTGQITLESQRSYQTHFFAVDPFVGLPEGEAVTPEDFVGRPWRSSAVYQDYLRPLGIRYLMGTDIYSRDGLECRLRATRASDAPPFGADDKALLRLIAPHVKRSIRLHARLDALECERALFAGSVNRMALGVVSLDQEGALLDLNPEARRILDARDGIAAAAHELSLEHGAERRQFQQLLRSALRGATVAGGGLRAEAMSVTRPSGRARLSLLVRPIPPGPFSESRRRPAVAVFLRDPEAGAAPSALDLARRLFGFTQAEATLALLLTAGHTLDDSAAQLGIGRNTARTHLQAVFGKTGVTRQAALVRLLHQSVLGLS